MNIVLTKQEWRHVLEWAKNIADTEKATAQDPEQSPDPKTAKGFYRRARTWARLSTKIKEGLKVCPKRKNI